MQNEHKLQRTILAIVSILFIAVIIWVLVSQISRLGKVEVTISALPKNSEIFIDDQKTGDRTIYLEPGEYIFSAKAEGYQEDKITVNVDEDSGQVILLPQPTNETLSALENNPQLQAEREALGGRQASLIGAQQIDRFPLLESLPRTDILGPYTIDYSLEDPSILLISDSSPKGRVNALKWIQSIDDISKYKIIYQDYGNPLVRQDSVE